MKTCARYCSAKHVCILYNKNACIFCECSFIPPKSACDPILNVLLIFVLTDDQSKKMDAISVCRSIVNNFLLPHKYFLCPHYIFIHLYAKKQLKNTTMNFKFFHKIPNQQNNSTFKGNNGMYLSMEDLIFIYLHAQYKSYHPYQVFII